MASRCPDIPIYLIVEKPPLLTSPYRHGGRCSASIGLNTSHSLFSNMKIGEVIHGEGDILCNHGKKTMEVKVRSVSDRAIQIGSHYHFFEVNKRLLFDRKKAYGMRLDIASGTAVRFEPGEEKVVRLVDYGGNRRVVGFHGLVNGELTEENLEVALKKGEQKGFNMGGD